ncbi:hypothetical protein AACI42_001419 [Escherichia coli]
MIKPFSVRYGHVDVREHVQLNDLNSDTRMALWNCLYLFLWTNNRQTATATKCAQSVWIYYLNQPADNIPRYESGYKSDKTLLTAIRDYIYGEAWYLVYDLIEFIIERTNSYINLSKHLNSIFKKHGVGYTIINGCITPISNDNEIESVQNAVDNGTDSSRSHFERALQLMTDREQPDYRNSIKESISAIESLCRKITGNDKGTLGACLKAIEEKGYIHSAMKGAFCQLYGYTSDQGGIRHALTEEDVNPTLAEAKFMLVTCSAFSNYLLSKISD